MKRILSLAFVLAAIASAASAQVPNPINAPSSVTPGDLITLSGHQASDSGKKVSDFLPVTTFTSMKATLHLYGDGVHDDTAALQAYFDSWGNGNIPPIYAENGTYDLQNLKLPIGHVKIICQSKYDTIFKLPDGSNATYMFADKNYVNNGTTVPRTKEIVGCAIDGNKAHNTGTRALVIYQGPFNFIDSRIFNSSGSNTLQSGKDINGTTCVSSAGNGQILNVRSSGANNQSYAFLDGGCGVIADTLIQGGSILSNNAANCDSSHTQYAIYGDRVPGFQIKDVDFFANVGCGDIKGIGFAHNGFTGNTFDDSLLTSYGAEDIDALVFDTSGPSNWGGLQISTNNFKNIMTSLPGSATGFHFANIISSGGSGTFDGSLAFTNNVMFSPTLTFISFRYTGSHVADMPLDGRGNTYDGHALAPSDPHIMIGDRFEDLYTHPTTLSGYGITDAQTHDSDLDCLAALSTAGIIHHINSTTCSAGSVTNGDLQFSGFTLNGHAVSLGASLSLVPDDISGLGYFATGTDASNLTGTVNNARLSAIPNSDLANPTVTISGHSLALGASLSLASGDISGLGYFATGTDASNLTGTVNNARLSAIPNSDLANPTVTISGRSLALGNTLNLVVGDVTGAAASGANGDITKLTSLANGSCSDPSLGWGAAYGFIYDSTNSATAFCANTAEISYVGSTGYMQSIPGGGASNITTTGDSTTKVVVQRYSTDTTGPVFECGKGRGTIASPAVPVTSDVICSLNARDWIGASTFKTVGQLLFGVSETATVDNTHAGAYFQISLAPNGSGTLTTVIQANNDGGVTIGSPSGGDKGVGTLNTTTLYEAGVALSTKYALAHLSGTTSSIGGSALTAGQCSSGTVSVTGATTGMGVIASPATYPGDGAYWRGYVSSTNTITVKVCAVVSLTPTSSAYNVRVIQ